MEDTVLQDATVERARDQLSLMAELVKRSVEFSLTALFESNSLLAFNVIDVDKAINSYEIDIDNITFGMLTSITLQGEILRSIVSIQKITPILERIGDHAVNIAESAISLAGSGDERELFCLPEMAELCKGVFRDSITSFFNKDPDIARDVMNRDEKIDELNVAIVKDIKEKVMQNRLSFVTALDIIRISKNLERIADLSMNIAEETIFALTGRNIKHSDQMIVQEM